MGWHKKRVKGSASLRRYLESEYMERDDAVIHISIYEGLQLFDPLSMGRQLELNPEIIDYIDHRTAIIPARIPVRICFHGGDLSDEQKQLIRKCLIEHYTVVMHDKQWDKRINTRKVIILAAFGIAILGFHLSGYFTDRGGITTEVLSIVASFTLWEAVDLFMLERTGIRKQLADTAQLMNQTVEFRDD